MIIIKHEGKEFSELPLEDCYFCRQPTPYWSRKGVCVCESCAQSHEEHQVPSKDHWVAAYIVREGRTLTAPMDTKETTEIAVKDNADALRKAVLAFNPNQ